MKEESQDEDTIIYKDGKPIWFPARRYRVIVPITPIMIDSPNGDILTYGNTDSIIYIHRIEGDYGMLLHGRKPRKCYIKLSDIKEDL